MAPGEWSDQQVSNYSALEDGKKRELLAPELRADRESRRPSGTYITIPISAGPMATQHHRSWLRRYWIFVLAMTILIVGGIIAGAVGGISASHQANQRGTG